MKHKKVLVFISVLLLSFIAWFFTREIQSELPYKVSGSEILEVKEKCKILAEKNETKWNTVFNIELVSSGYSEYGGYCYMEYFSYFDDWTAKVLYNTTDEKEIITREWPERAGLYQKGFNMFVNGKRRYYQNSF